MTWMRPGPARLAPHLAPGGYVAHVYGVDDGRLVYAATIQPGDDLEAAAIRDADAATAMLNAGEAMCLVLFDGDTGERTVPPGLLRRVAGP